MDKIVVSIGGKERLIYSAGQAEYVLVQPVDDHDLEVLDEQVTAIAKAVPVPFVFVAFPVTDWNRELSPWDSPAVFGPSDFGHGAVETLGFIEKVLLSAVCLRCHLPEGTPWC